METEIKTPNHSIQQPTGYNMDNLVDYSQEFKLEMENSISIYFSKCDGDSNDSQSLKSNTTHNETLIDNTSEDVEYVTPTSLKGISDFMIHQVFSTERIVPIESDDEDSKLETTEVVEVPSTTENKMSSFNSDDTLNNNSAESSEKEKEEEEEDQTNPRHSKTISKAFADEFIDLLNINMKELNSKKDDFHVIGLKKIEETKENTEKVPPTNSNSNETNEIKFKEEINLENNDNKPKSNKKKSKYISIFNLEKSHSFRISRSKSTSSEKSSSKTLTDTSESLNKEMKKSKSKLDLFKIFKNIKKRLQKY